MMASWRGLILALAAFVACASAAHIVALPHPGGASHVFIVAKIGLELASRGHEVSILTAEMDLDFAESRLKGSSVKVVPYDAGYDAKHLKGVIYGCTKQSPLDCSVTITATCINACRSLLNDTRATSVLERADLLIADMSHACGYLVGDKFNIPNRVDLSPVGFYDPWGAMHWGVPSPAAYVPQLGSKLSNKMDFGQRLHNQIVQSVLYYITPKLDFYPDELRKEIGVERTHTASARSSGMYLVNVDWATEFPRPITPVTKVVGPILPEPPKALPADLEQFVSSAPNGVMIVSLGTLAEVVLTPTTTQTLADVFSTLPVRVLWKLTTAIPERVGENTKIVSWFPQNDLLGHDNVRAFFTHGGMNSIQEAAYHGVASVGFPQFADQFDNVIRLVAAGMAIEVRGEDFTAEALTNAVNTILTDKSYTENAKKVSARMKDRLRTPAQESADWIEFALNHESGRYMRVPSLDMPWYRADNLDVIATLLGVFALILYGLYRLVARFLGFDNARALVVILFCVWYVRS